MDDATEAEQESVGRHYDRLLEFLEEGRLVLAGPCTDGVGPGIVVFEAATRRRRGGSWTTIRRWSTAS